MFKRLLAPKIAAALTGGGKVIVLVGPRQTGKTTLCETLLQGKTFTFFNGDHILDREKLNTPVLEILQQVTNDAPIIFIDEAQKIKEIGQALKLLIDHYKKDKKILVTGSSSFHILDQTQETLTGRKIVFRLFPLSLEEIAPMHNPLNLSKVIPDLLIYGSYPEVVTSKSYQAKRELLYELTSSYLYKDILEFQKLKNPDLLTKLLRALALQVGSEVSLNELSNLLGIDKKTVEHYIDLLEKSFVVFRVGAFSQNQRREISRNKKVYFYDLGIRNAIINNFNPIDSRSDIGALWENFLMVERLKFRSYHDLHANFYFWRTYDGKEVDLVEEYGGKFFGYEFKWNPKRASSNPLKWEAYPEASLEIITPQNLIGFLFTK